MLNQLLSVRFIVAALVTSLTAIAGVSQYSVIDLGTLGGTHTGSYAHGINTSGQVVGDARTFSNSVHAFLYGDGAMHDLGTLGDWNSMAVGINARGQVIGSADTASQVSHPFLHSGGVMQDMTDMIVPASGWTQMVLTDINDNGWIVGYGINAAGQNHAFLLTPVPEPSTLCAASVFGLLVTRRRRVRPVA